MNKIDHFAHENDFLSNFYSIIVTYEGVDYASTEHAYQASKTLDLEKRWIFALKNNPQLTAGKAKKIGRNLKLRSDWDKVKVSIMRELLLQKFSHNELTAKLLATEEAYLEEGNWWEDRFWGVCYGGLPEGLQGRKCKKWPHEPIGDNVLGNLLMEIRSILGIKILHDTSF